MITYLFLEGEKLFWLHFAFLTSMKIESEDSTKRFEIHKGKGVAGMRVSVCLNEGGKK